MVGSKRMQVVCALLVAGVLGLQPKAWAQTVTGSVTGEVTDPSGALIAHAHVTAENLSTGVKTEGETNSSGVYSLRFLPIGQYRVTVDAAGFGPLSTPVFTLEINQTVKLNEKLSVGAASTVDVTTAVPLINTADGVLSTTFSENEIQNFPLEGRNFQSVALYSPGVVNTDPTGMTGGNATERSTTSNNLISVNGNRGQANYYSLDGSTSTSRKITRSPTIRPPTRSRRSRSSQAMHPPSTATSTAAMSSPS